MIMGIKLYTQMMISIGKSFPTNHTPPIPQPKKRANPGVRGEGFVVVISVKHFLASCYDEEKMLRQSLAPHSGIILTPCRLDTLQVGIAI